MEYLLIFALGVFVSGLLIVVYQSINHKSTKRHKA